MALCSQTLDRIASSNPKRRESKVSGDFQKNTGLFNHPRMLDAFYKNHTDPYLIRLLITI